MTVSHENAAHEKARQSAPSPQHTQGQHQGQPAAYEGKANENASQSPYSGEADTRNAIDRDGNTRGTPPSEHGGTDVKPGKTDIPGEKNTPARKPDPSSPQTRQEGRR